MACCMKEGVLKLPRKFQKPSLLSLDKYIVFCNSKSVLNPRCFIENL